MSETGYDRAVILEHARRLNSRARTTFVLCSIAGAILGALCGSVYAELFTHDASLHAAAAAHVAPRAQSAAAAAHRRDSPAPDINSPVATDRAAAVSGMQWVAILLGLLAGVSVGYDRAFRFQLEAQLALCQAQIELNSRELLSRFSAPPA